MVQCHKTNTVGKINRLFDHQRESFDSPFNLADWLEQTNCSDLHVSFDVVWVCWGITAVTVKGSLMVAVHRTNRLNVVSSNMEITRRSWRTVWNWKKDSQRVFLPCKQSPSPDPPVWQRRIRGLFQGNTGRDVAHAQLLLGRQEGATKQQGNYTAHLAAYKFPLGESNRASLPRGTDCRRLCWVIAPVTHSYGNAKSTYAVCPWVYGQSALICPAGTNITFL